MEDFGIPLDFDQDSDQQCMGAWNGPLNLMCSAFEPHGITPAPSQNEVCAQTRLAYSKLWKEGLDWDESLCQHIHHEWLAFKEQVKALNDVKFPHAFSDASEKACEAAVYIRSIDQQGIIMVRLLCATSRIALLKQISQP